MTVRIIDIETTGTDPATDKVCEIASLDLSRMSGKYIVTNARSVLVNPGIPIPAQASAVHHLIDADVATAPPLEQVFDQFCQPHDGRLIAVAHNAPFEKSFLEPHFAANECEVQWICTYRVALRVWPDLPSHTNQFLRYHLGFVDPLGLARADVDPHRALPDCYVTGAIFLALSQRAKFEEMLVWSAEPALRSVLTFGKHKGLRYDAAPRDYLEWLADKSDMDADTKFSARYWLNARGQP